MTEKTIIIIGAGIAGLSAGCYAQMNGYRTHIFEQHTGPGGLCTAWKRGDYTIDGCLHWLGIARPDSPLRQVCHEVGALEGNRIIPLDHYARFTDEASEQSLDITTDLDLLERAMKALAPGDESVIDELVRDVRAWNINLFSNKPAELAGPLDKLKQLWGMRRITRYLNRYDLPVMDYAKRIQNPFLRWALTNFFVPEMPMLALWMLLRQWADGQCAVIEGGSGRFASAIARRFESLGGVVTYGAAVEEILVESCPEQNRGNDRAVGMRLAIPAGTPPGSSEHRADVVISAIDGYDALFKLLGGRYVDQTTHDRYDNWPIIRPLVLVSFGVARQFPGERIENVIALQRPILIGSHQVDLLWFRVFDYDPTLAPPGKTVVQAYFAADYDYWNDLQKDRPRYAAEKERVAVEVLDRLEFHLPGIAAHVEMTDVATPFTFWRYTRNRRGAFMGWLGTPQVMKTRIRKTLPGLDNFYMTGQWVEPGGGVSQALTSGRKVVQLICHRDKKPFVTSVP